MLISERLRQGPLPLSEATDLAMQVADALEEAHSYGIVHRDIKGANVIVTAPRGLAKVLDFGLAKFMPGAAQPTDATQLQLTTPGVVLGTVSYMSPEQILARDVDHRSDLFSLGVLLFEMLAGRLPFMGESVTEVTDAILHREPPALARFNYEVPTGLETLVRKALQKDGAYRYQSAREMYIDLHNLQLTRDDGPSGSRPASSDVRQAEAPETPREPTIAVMTFANITGDGTDDWIGLGISETVTTGLKAVPGLQIISRAQIIDVLKNLSRAEGSAFDDRLAINIERRLSTTWIVGGGYQRVGDQIRITGHLLEIESAALQRTVKIDGSIEDIFELQDKLVYELSQSLNLTLDQTERARNDQPGTQSVEAYEAFSKGMSNLRSDDLPSIDRAMHLLEKAITLDPSYAPPGQRSGPRTISRRITSAYRSSRRRQLSWSSAPWSWIRSRPTRAAGSAART